MRKKAIDVFLNLTKSLEEFNDSSVLIGGWIPFLLTDFKKENNEFHVGSFDIDLLMSPEVLKSKTSKFKEVLEKEQFYHSYTGPRFTYYRDVPREGCEPLIIQMDVVCGDYYFNESPVRYRKLRGVTLRTARAGSLALIDPVNIKIKYLGEYVKFRIVNPVAFLILKSMVMAERERKKDSYDVFFILKNSIINIDDMIASYKKIIHHPVIYEGLSKLYNNFNSIDAPGCWSVARMKKEKSSLKRSVRFILHNYNYCKKYK
jgi:hypothetical protein